jgi:periplasmic divalent cation tolerance protein
VSENHAIVVLVTAGSSDQAANIARSLVEERLAACVNVVPVRSIYRWEGKVADDGEWLLVVKTTRERFDAVEARIRELHSYAVPEVIALDVALSSRPYLDWLLGSVLSA